MRTKHIPFGQAWRELYPALRMYQDFEGGTVYVGEVDGKPCLLVDGGTMAEFLEPEDAGLLGSLTALQVFDSEEERAAYLRAQFPARNKSRG